MAKRKLKDTEVHRGGRTARYINFETRDVELSSEDKRALRLDFCMDSKGGGTTVVYVDIGPRDFVAFIETMVEVDRQAAIATMSAEMARQVAEQPVHDARTAAKARNAVRSAARQKYLDAPSENRDTELLISQRVKRLVDELDKSEEAVKNTSNSGVDAEVTQVH